MRGMGRCLLAAIAAVGVVLMVGCAQAGTPNALGGTQQVVIEGCDWGPAVTKAILCLDQEVDASTVRPGDFQVVETHEPSGVRTGGAHQEESVPRMVADAYACDAQGERTEAASSRYVALELACGPELGSPFRYDFATSQVTWSDPYELRVSLLDGAGLRRPDGAQVRVLDIATDVDLDAALIPQLEGVELDESFTGTDGQSLTYASFSPAEDGEEGGATHPLVIWLHGAGEGGTDPRIAVLGNKVSALLGREFQESMGGAYVLCPQTPLFWMVYDASGDWQDNPGTDSIYLATLKELIDKYVADHPGIDRSRIYVGGCSNGGYMTMDLLANYPGYFAAGFPICEAYLDAGLDDVELAAVAQTPTWFTWARNDTTVDPSRFEEPTGARLRALGADVHTSVFDDVHDTSGLYAGPDGAPYQYQGHFSWVYFFDGLCEEDGVRLWDWLAAQRLG